MPVSEIEATSRGADPGPSADAVARHWAEAARGHVVCALHFGSTRTGASPGKRSAHDLFLIVDEYEGFYEAAFGHLGSSRSARFLARTNRLLPPNVMHGTGPANAEAKLFLLSEHDLAAATGPHPKDHFVRARLAQDVAVVWARDDVASRRAADVLGSVRRGSTAWMRPFLRGDFLPAEFARRMLEVSYAGEVRPESAGRVQEVFASQQKFLEREYGRVLEEAAREGRLVARGAAFAYAQPAGLFERTGARVWFVISRLRATLRWAKYVLTFEGWLDYVAAKAERRTGVPLPLSTRERRWPLIFLWPKFFRVMRARGGPSRERTL